jgi:hypothetical protein
VCLCVAGTAGGGSRIIRVFPEQPADSGNCWRMTAGRKLSPALVIFERVIPESVVAVLRLELMARSRGDYKDAMISTSQWTDRMIELVAINGEGTLAALQYDAVWGWKRRILSGEPIDFSEQSREAFGVWNMQFTVSGNEWRDDLFPLPEFQNTRTETGGSVTLKYEFPPEQPAYRVVLVMESYPA